MLTEEINQASPSQLAAHQHRKDLRARLAGGAVTDTVTKIEILPPPKPPQVELPKFKPTVIPLGIDAGSLVRLICIVVARKYQVDAHDVISRRRGKQICKAKHAAYFIAKKVTLWSLPEIGRRIGGRDHTTILHGLRKVERVSAHDPEYAAEVEALRAYVANQIREAAGG